MNLRRWLTIGIGVKRWLALAFLGLLVLALGVAHVLRQAVPGTDPTGPAGVVVGLLTLRFLPYELRGAVAAGAGLGAFGLGAYRLVRALVDPFAAWERDQPMVEVIYQRRLLARGPRIVAIGGGTGLSTLLRGLKEESANLTAVVTVADDGGSSGILRDELGIPAVGDIRNCIVALADAEPPMRRLLQHRFTSDGPAAGSGLGGHAVGNLLLAALAQESDGDFEAAVREMHRVLAVRGRVVPSTGTALTLHARLADGTEVAGQSRITRTSHVERVWIEPEGVRAAGEALRAIGEAELVVIGPGSLYTSILPALLVPGIREAVAASGALVVLVANVATQPGETGGFDLADHVEALDRHGAGHLADVVLANDRFDALAPSGWLGEPVRLRWPPRAARVPELVLDDIVDPVNAHHHDPARLAAAIVRVHARGGSRRVGRRARIA